MGGCCVAVGIPAFGPQKLMESSQTMKETPDIHVSEAAVDIRPNGSVWYESKAFKSLIALSVIVRWVVIGMIFIGGIYMYQRDVNAQTGMSVADIGREEKLLREVVEQNRKDTIDQLSDIKKSTLTIDLFNARFDAMNRRLDRLESALDRIQPR